MTTHYLATYRTDNTYKGYSTVNRHHWEVGFHCYHIDYTEERQDTDYAINGMEPAEYYKDDVFQLAFFNYRGDIVRRSNFKSRTEANEAVKAYIKIGFKRSTKQ